MRIILAFLITTIFYSPGLLAQDNLIVDSDVGCLPKIKLIIDSSLVNQDSINKIKKLKQKKLLDSLSRNEFSVSYQLNICNSDNNATIAETYNGAIKTLYLKKDFVKVKFAGLLRTQSIYYYGKPKTKSKQAYLVKESGKPKYLYTLTDKNWKTLNNKYDSIRIKLDTAGKYEILNMQCKLAHIYYPTGDSILVYYLPGYNNAYIKLAEPLFARIPGLTLRYEYHKKKQSIVYMVTNIDFTPIPASLLQVPKVGVQSRTFTTSKEIIIDKALLNEEEGAEGEEEDEETSPEKPKEETKVAEEKKQ